MKESDHLVTLAQKFWDTHQVLFARGRTIGYLRASSQNVRRSECGKAAVTKGCASDNVLIASDGSGGSRETPKSVRQVAFGVAPSRCSH